ncbi:NAD(P)/FAD-dependent oxidoreductase [Rossellomorea aquimaris]|uniref:NAD(P)/FAD-dependent oxidoreductase n=1 Tax=Rossellomorea aquimaris TaxID=189382 RepID=UPI001CD36F76|nr:FAD-dependent oxidoreductase [Rossellomorea aquimaris]MCA1054243.1 NAD(P)/FAD-dependent oxidoreductase [Rossellomorea aquimaris]
MKKVDIVILGGGPAGIAAAIWCKRLGINHLLLEEREELGGQLKQIKNIVMDYPGLNNMVGKDLERQFLTHLDELNCHYDTRITLGDINADSQTLTYLKDDSTNLIHYQFLIVATGASPRRLGIPGESEMLQRNEIYSASVDAYRFEGKHVAVVGGGDRALEGALLLSDHGVNVTLIHRSERFRARMELMEPALQRENITVLTNHRVKEIMGVDRVSSIRIEDEQGGSNNVDVSAVLVRIGVQPNSDFLKHIVELDAEGHIVTDSFGVSSRSSICAIGDVCTKPFYSSISTSTGQAMTLVKHLSTYLH